MWDMRNYIQRYLIGSFKNYHNVIQDTLIEMIAQKLDALYQYSLLFPNIISPNSSRLDILTAIADQFSFTIREEADIQEQIDILDNILYVYRKRGSTDTIESMWKYYGGTLPKEVKIVTPRVFRYNISTLSGSDATEKGSLTHILLDTVLPGDITTNMLAVEVGTTRYRRITHVTRDSNELSLATVDGLSIGSKIAIEDKYTGTITDIVRDTSEVNSLGIYDVKLYNNTYPIKDLKEFMTKELTAAGVEIRFSNILYSDILRGEESTNPYIYNVLKDTKIYIELDSLHEVKGFRWDESTSKYSSYYTKDPREKISDYYLLYLSGNSPILIDIKALIELGESIVLDYTPRDIVIYISTTSGDIEYVESEDQKSSITSIKYNNPILRQKNMIHIESLLYCTPDYSDVNISRNLLDVHGEYIDSPYPGYFILNSTLLGEEVI